MRHLIAAAACLAAVAVTPQALAQDAGTVETQGYGAAGSGWTYQGQLYLWGTDIGGSSPVGDFDVGFDVLLENLNFALMGGLRAFNGNWMGYGELAYANVGKSDSFKINPGPGPGVNVDGDLEVRSTTVGFGAGYRLADTPNHTVYGTFGIRYLALDLDLDLKGPNRGRGLDERVDTWDAVVGLNGEARINENWFVPWIVDIGAGQSDLTWQAGLGVGYRFGRNDVVFGYRHMEWDLPDDEPLSSYHQTGPLLMWNFRF